ncbi:MAG: hypothetical protein OHK0053_34910 [Microscillaceae bacterium]
MQNQDLNQVPEGLEAALLGQMPYPVLAFSAFGKCLYANKIAANLLGAGALSGNASLTGDNFLPSELSWAQFWRNQEKHPIMPLEPLHLEASPLPYTGIAYQIQFDGQMGSVWVLQPVSRPTPVPTNEDNAQALFEAIFAHSQDAISIADAKSGYFLKVNASACRRWGYTEAELLSMKSEVIHYHELDKLYAHFEQVMEEGFAFSHLMSCQTRTAQQLAGQVTSIRITYQGREAVLSLTSDLSERKRYKRLLADKNRALEKLLVEKNDLIQELEVKNEDLRSQEEELEQSLEELQAVYEQMLVEKEAAEKLLHQVERLKRLIDASREVIGEATLDGQILYLNPAALALLNLPPNSEPSQWCFADFKSRKTVLKIEKEILPQLLSQGSWQGELEIGDSFKNTLILETVAFLIENQRNEAQTWGLIARNVSEEKKLLKKIKELAERFQLIEQGTREGFWEVEHQQGLRPEGIIWTSAQYKLLLGLPPDFELSLRYLNEHLHPEDKKRTYAAFYQHLHQTGRNRVDYDVEYRMRHTNGTYRWFRAFGTSLRDAEGRPLLTAGSLTDITHSKDLLRLQSHLEDEIRSQTAALDRANRAKSVFLANMSHELRTPLNGIMGFAQLLLRSPRLTDAETSQVQTIFRSGQYLLSLINDVLDISQIEAGRLELNPEVASLPDLIQSIEVIFRMEAQQKKLSFLVEMAPMLPNHIKVDAKRLRQIIYNLLSNAFKFTEQGQVSLFLTQTTQDPEQADSFLQIVVADTGPGIPADKQAQIFEPFTRLIQKDRTISGVGLGLAITRELVRLMNGQISIKSQMGQGTIFTISLPLQKVEAGSREIQVSSPTIQAIMGYQGIPRTILVVEDILENRQLLVSYLHSLGFKTLVAQNGQEVLNIHWRVPPDLVLMDLIMPLMDGFQTIAFLRSQPFWQKVPFVALSASVYDDDIQKSLAMGFDAFLAKPFTFEELNSLLSRFLEIEWLYRPEQKAEVSQATAPPLPPDALLDSLRHLLQTGDILAIRKEIKHLIQSASCFIISGLFQPLIQAGGGTQFKSIEKTIGEKRK